MNIRKFVSVFIVAIFSLGGASANSETNSEENLWQATYDARQKYFENSVGPLPTDIMKMLNMTVVWPGGGLFEILAQRLGSKLSVYTTFGLTNTDMPTSVQMNDFSVKSDGENTTQVTGRLSKKTQTPKQLEVAGYGYEFMVVAQSGEQWPLNLLQWVVNAEIKNNVGFLARVEKYDGLTVEQIDVGDGQIVNILIAKAVAPLPTGTLLPNGNMKLLVATTITEQEMNWSKINGRGVLLTKLRESGVGQVSTIGRQSVVQ